MKPNSSNAPITTSGNRSRTSGLPSDRRGHEERSAQLPEHRVAFGAHPEVAVVGEVEPVGQLPERVQRMARPLELAEVVPVGEGRVIVDGPVAMKAGEQGEVQAANG